MEQVLINTLLGDIATIGTGATNGASQTNINYRGAIITAMLGIVTGTSPTLKMQLQWSPDNGTTWLNYGSSTGAISVATGNTVTIFVYPTNTSVAGATPGAFTIGSTGSVILNAPLPATWRIVYTGAGTTPVIPLSSVYVNYLF